MSFLDIVGGIFKPIADVVTHVLPSGDAKIQLQQQIMEAQFKAATSMMDYEKQLLDSQAKIITAEAQGNSWIQRSWRPITMLTFLALVVADSLNWLPNRLAEQAWTLLQIGLGGYVGGRSIEKVAPAITQAIASARSSK
jgi:hypothetical protein